MASTLHRFHSLCSRAAASAFLAAFAIVLAGCGGHHHHGSAEMPDGDAPTITAQPADRSVSAGQSASFSVEADGSAPLAYQWRRDGADIAGATGASFTLPAAAVADSGAGFSVDVANGFGHVVSRSAVLSVSVAPPVLTVTAQPADVSVVAGATASFTVAASCSAGTLHVQWQRSPPGGTYADVAGATLPTHAFATVAADNAAAFRAALDCSGQSATTSSAATLSVSAAGGLALSAQPIVGRVDQADIASTQAIVRAADGSYLFATSSRVMRLAADLKSIATVAGGETTGSADGPAASARFSAPSGLALDSAGVLYVADTNNHTIRRIAADGTVTTIAGTAEVPGNVDGSGAAARFAHPIGIAFGPDGDLYVADAGNHRIRRMSTGGAVATYAGSSQGYGDGAALSAQFNNPVGIAVAANGDLLVADFNNGRIRRVARAGSTAGAVDTIAGGGPTGSLWPDGTGSAATIPGPSGLQLAGSTLTLHDQAGLLRQVDIASHAVTTLAGSRTAPGFHADGGLATARFGGIGGIAKAADGSYVVADDGSLRTVSAAGDVRTIANDRAVGITATGTGVLAQMPLALASPNFNPIGINTQAVAVDPSGDLILAEGRASIVRRVSPAGAITPIAGLVGNSGADLRNIDGTGSEAQFQALGGAIACDAAGTVYVGDGASVRRIGSDNAVTLLAGSRTATGAADGSATNARFKYVQGLAVRGDGSVFVADPFNRAIRRIDPSGNVTTWAGALGQEGTADGPGVSARLSFPNALAFAPDGALLVADNGRLRRIAADGSAVTTLVAPAGAAAVGGDLVVDSDGSAYWGGNTSTLFSSGIWKLAPGATEASLVVRTGGDVVLGSGPTAQVGPVVGMALAGPRQLVVLSVGQIVRIALP